LKNTSSNRGGFTLIELLIVVAIIAILAAIAVPNFLEAQVRSKVSRAKTDMRSLATALESYRVDNNKPVPIVAVNSPRWLTPPHTAGLINGPSVFIPGAAQGVSSRFVRLTTPIAYISSVFRDPFINESVGRALDPNTQQPNDIYDTYDYVDAPTLSPGGMLQVAGSNRGASVTSGAEWHLVSAGPDLMNAFGGGNQNYSLNERLLGCDYDPTNGSTSPGDVVRVASAPGEFPDTSLIPRYNRISGKITVP